MDCYVKRMSRLLEDNGLLCKENIVAAGRQWIAM